MRFHRRPSTVRSDEWPAWFSFWFSGCWRALAKGTAWAGLYCAVLLLRCGFIEGEFTPMPPLTRLAAWLGFAREHAVARVQHTKKAEFEMDMENKNQRPRIALELDRATLPRGR